MGKYIFFGAVVLGLASVPSAAEITDERYTGFYPIYPKGWRGLRRGRGLSGTRWTRGLSR